MIVHDFCGFVVASANLDALQEFKMQTNNFSAEYGQLAGGVMNMVLKTGGNQYHGSLFEFFRNNALDGATFSTCGPRSCGRTNSAASCRVR